MNNPLKWSIGFIVILILLVGVIEVSVISAQTEAKGQITLKEDEIDYKYKNIINLDMIEFNQYKETWQRDIVYKKVNGEELKLDLFLPQVKLTPTYPVVVYVHGGGFIRGDKDEVLDLKPLLKSWLEEGWAVISVNYRLLYGDTMFPDNYEDIKSALKWVEKNKSTYDFNPDNISLVGHSAGGSLALLAGLQTEKVDCVVSLAGPTKLYGNGEFELRRKLISILSRKQMNQDLLKDASPIQHLSKTSPPVFLVHGTQDNFVPYDQSKLFYEKAKKLGVETNLVTIEGGGHILEMSYLPRMHEFKGSIIEFMNKHLEGNSSFGR